VAALERLKAKVPSLLAEADRLEEQMLRLPPEWYETQRAIVGALLPYPGALRAVEKALGELPQHRGADDDA
jgi:hypothetical protein